VERYYKIDIWIILHQSEQSSGVLNSNKNKLAIGYVAGNPLERRSIVTCFNVNLIDDICYLIWINRNEQNKNQDLGRSLIKIIENLAKN